MTADTLSTAHVPLRGSVCECTVCLARFGSESGFDHHRITEEDGRRRCLTPAELIERGWRIGARGWTASKPGQFDRFTQARIADA